MEWRPGDPVAPGLFTFQVEHSEAYHRQCAEAKDNALALHLTKIPREEAKDLLRAIGERHGKERRQHLIDLAVAIKGPA